MNTKVKLISTVIFFLFITNTIAQTPMEEYVKKNGVEKIKKKFVVDALSHPATHKSFKDGHGKTPYLTSTDQLPTTIGLITFQINKGVLEGKEKINWLEIPQLEYNFLVEGGNAVATLIEVKVMKSLKDAFTKRGASLLTPREYIDNEEKFDFYFNSFTPEVSKVGKFLSNIESRRTDISVCATSYRYFDMGAALDYKRSQSLGYELGKYLGVEGLLSIGIDLYMTKKGIFVSRIKMTIHGSNPNPKIDKKYFGQKTGTGYYKGQLFFGGSFAFKKPIEIVNFSKEKESIDGLDIILASFIEKYYDEMDKAIAKVSK